MVSILQVENLTKSFGDLTLFENISFGIGEGQRVAIVAKNGAGKTTLLNIIAGRESADSGAVIFRRDLRISYLEQNPYHPSGLSVLEACFYSQNETVQAIAEYEQTLLSNDHSKLDEAMAQMDALKAWNYELQAKQILTKLKIEDLSQKVEHLSGGQLKRIALANVLISEPELLILDEPTNHLDLDMIEWFEDYLIRSKMSLLMVTHDRYFLDRVCNDILEIENKQLYSYKGNYSCYLEKRQERVEVFNAELDRANNLLRKELEWMRRMPQARGTKAKSRIDAFYELKEKASQKRYEKQVRLNAKSSYLGKKIFEAKYISKSYGEIKILEDFAYTFSRGEKMGIVGRNGTGKSTFLKLLMGEVKPDRGSIDVGETVVFGYYSQDGLQLNEGMKVIDVVREIAEEVRLGDGRKMSVSQFLNYFMFTPEVQHNYVSKLSGGEKRRLYLCTVLMKSPNFLILDEPTNDLDIVTLNVLEEYLQSFEGCVIVVSHDRYFMDKIVDHLLVFEGNARIKDFPGNYTQYREWRELQEKKNRQQKVNDSESTKSTKILAPRDDGSEQKRRPSYREREELKQLEKDIEQLEKEKTELEKALSSGALNNDDLMQKSTRIGEVNDLLDEKGMRWLELSEIEN
ncbi:MAG: ABC-F family ATP-binding cassette domain-containing protein [Prevotellaceae bacterium]|jgi:ATP-binding cassette subfamily F protein uup|nr:ABC-F family ATP-binding cassette domain-containing protein [Prevotellaceae bacterium]